MAQPKTGRSHTRSSMYVASGLYVSGNARVVGSINTSAGLATGSVKQRSLGTGSNGVLYQAHMSLHPFSYSTSASFTANLRAYAVTGKTAPGLKFRAPQVAITVHAIALSFMTAPAGGNFRISLRSIPSAGAQVHKGYSEASGKIAMYFGGLSATIPANNAAGICINRAGGSASGTDLNVTVFYTRNE
jgi:hypothetical protein